MSDLVPMLKLDLHTLASSGRLLWAYLLLALVFSAGGATFALPLIAMLGMIVGLNLVGTAEVNRLPLLYGALPLRRRTVIVAHYLVSAAVTAVAVAAGVTVTGVAGLLRGEPLGDPVFLGLGVVSAVFCVMALMLPLYLRWGTRRAAVIMALVAMVGFGIGMLLTPTSVADGAGDLGRFDGLMLAAGAALGMAALVVSLLVSIRIYERQDH